MDIFTATAFLILLYFGEDLVALGRKLPQWLIDYIRDWE